MRFNRVRACVIGAAVAVSGALAVLPSTASATLACGGASDSANVVGVGASFARAAQLQWGAEIIAPDPGGPLTSGNIFQRSAAGCTSFTGNLDYAPAGSGAGRAAVGATDTANQRLTGVAASLRDVLFGGADEAPTTTQIGNAWDGNPAVTYDDTPLHTIPVAQSAIAIDVRLPTGCSVTASSTNRQIASTTVEAAFRGLSSADTWGEILPSITGAGCSAASFDRVVRFDSSGTTFQFKRYLFGIYSGDIDPGTAGTQTWASVGNTAWPAGSTPVVTSDRISGAGAQLDTLSGTAFTLGGVARVASGIAYADVATSRGREYGWGTSTNDANDVRFWVYTNKLADNPSTPTDERRQFVSPALDNASTPTTSGANCRNVTYSAPSSTRGTRAVPNTWFNVNANPTFTDYPICALTYALAWEDPAQVNRGLNGDATRGSAPYTAGQATAVENYLDYIVDASGGQSVLNAIDYAPLPAGIRATAQAGVDALTYTG